MNYQTVCSGCGAKFANLGSLGSHGRNDPTCTPEMRFWGRVQKGPQADCWPYLGSIHHNGYGRVNWKGKQVHSHRVAWLIANGDIPKGMAVLHHCDNPVCCNPAHLFLGNDAVNVADKVAKGRHPVGEKAWNAVLTDEAVRAIRREYRKAGPRKQDRSNARELAKKYGVKVGQIHAVIAGRNWSHVK